MKNKPEIKNKKFVFYDKEGRERLLPLNIDVDYYLAKGFTLSVPEEETEEKPKTTKKAYGAKKVTKAKES